jgi:hypothetical protein
MSGVGVGWGVETCGLVHKGKTSRSMKMSGGLHTAGMKGE